MPKRPDETFQIPKPEDEGNYVLDLLGGVVRKRPLSGEEALRQEEEFLKQAKAGRPEAICHVAGRLLRSSPDAEANRKAVRLMKKGLASGHPDLVHLFAVCALRGQGMKKNVELGVRLLRQAALDGCPQAEFDYAKACLMGIAGFDEKDRAGEALKWLRLASAAGLPCAGLEAARIYRDGAGVPKDYKEALKWYERSAAAGLSAAQHELALMHLKRDFEDRSPEQARRWMNEAAISGVIDAQYRLAIFCWSGAGGKVAVRESVRWLIRAAEAGHASAMSMLAGFFLTGNGLDRNPANAYALYLAADRLGDASAPATSSVIRPMLSQDEVVRAQAASRMPARQLLEELIPKNKR